MRSRLVQGAAVVALMLTPSPAAASDFTPMRVLFFGTYYLLAFGLWYAVRNALRRTKLIRAANSISALLATALFAPSAAPSPNALIAWPVVLLFGRSTDQPLVSLASFLATGVAVWWALKLLAQHKQAA